jgi:hypothetical protein
MALAWYCEHTCERTSCLTCRDLSYLETQLSKLISQKQAQEQHELDAAEDSPYLQGKPALRPLQPCTSALTDCASCGFSVEHLRNHPFHRECVAAVASKDADVTVPAAEGTVQDMSDDETGPGAVYWAFAALEDNAHALLSYMTSEVCFLCMHSGASTCCIHGPQTAPRGWYVSFPPLVEGACCHGAQIPVAIQPHMHA